MNSGFQESFDFLSVIFKRVHYFLLAMIAGAILSFALSEMLSPKFKSESTISIHSGYYTVPMVGDLINEIRTETEMKAHKKSLVQLVMDDSFIDQVSKDFFPYQYPEGHPRRHDEREKLRKRILIHSTDVSNIIIQTIADEAEKSQAMNKLVMKRLVAVFKDSRMDKIKNARDALHSSLESIGVSSEGKGTSVPTMNTGTLKRTIKSLQVKKRALKSRFTSNHPQVISVSRMIKSLELQLNEAESNEKSGKSESKTFMNLSSRDANKEVRDDLVKKLNHLNLLLEIQENGAGESLVNVTREANIPAQAYFPKKLVMIPAGAGFGFFLMLVISIFFELRRGTFLSPQKAADFLGVSFIGELPAMKSANRKLLDYTRLQQITFEE